MINIIYFLIEKISIKLDPHKTKGLVDIGFIIAEKIIINLEKLHFIYFNFYEEMTNKEILMADIKEDEKVLHIGCGPVPATCILISKNTDANVVGIDKNMHSVKQARKCVDKYNQSDKIKIIHSSLKGFILNDFNLIIISQGIKPYNKSIIYIAENMNKDAQIIFRTSSVDKKEIAKIDRFLKKIFEIEKRVNHEEHGLLTSLLLTKK